MKISDKISAIRNALNLNKKEFAEAIHVSPSYVTQIEAGKKDPSDSLLDLMMAKWNINEEWWEDGDGPIFKKEDEILLMVLNEVRRQYDGLAAGGAVVDRSKAATVILEKLAELGRG